MRASWLSLLLLVVLAAPAGARPQLAAGDAPRGAAVTTPGRLVYANDDDWQWRTSGLVPATFDYGQGTSEYYIPSPDRPKAVVIVNCCGDRGGADDSGTTRDVDALVRVLRRGGDVILLDDGDLLVPVVLELLARLHADPACLHLDPMPVQWIDGRTRQLVPNRGIEELAACVGAGVRTFVRDAGDMPGRALVIGTFPSPRSPALAR